MRRNVVLVGDALERLRQLPSGSVDVVVTSPSFESPRVLLPRTCIDPSASWPWLGR